VQCTGAFKSDLGNVMCSHDKFLIWISWVLYLNLFLINVWYVRTGSNLCSMMTWIFYPKLYLYIVDTCLYLLMIIAYIYIWWQFLHLYDLWNMNKWMNSTQKVEIAGCFKTLPIYKAMQKAVIWILFDMKTWSLTHVNVIHINFCVVLHCLCFCMK